MCAEQQAFRPSGEPSQTASRRVGDDALGRALALVRHLRARCPWDARQTPVTLRPYLLEEAHEAAEAIARGDDPELARELGDVLLNLAFQIVLAEERGAFGAAEVVEGLEEKMRRRHPHVYGDAEEPPDWEALKAAERGRAEGEPGQGAGSGARSGAASGAPEAGTRRVPDPFEGVPSGLDSLSRATRYQERAAGLHFDWPSALGALDKLREEADELARLLPPEAGRGRDARRPRAEPGVAEEVGDLLFAAVNVARLAGVHPAVALDAALEKFAARFRRLLALAAEAGVDPRLASFEALDALWERTKAEERGGDASGSDVGPRRASPASPADAVSPPSDA